MTEQTKQPGAKDPKLQQAFRLIAGLTALLLFAGGAALWLWFGKQPKQPVNLAVFHPASVSGNMVKEWYPGIDFQPMYPDLSPEEIDQVQRETFDIRFVYTPYIQFRGLPVKKRFIETSPEGYRKNAGPLHPWPLDNSFYNVFVFGGSTTFGSGLPDHETVVAHLERELSGRITNRTVRCYNFGAGYYFSTQERILFEDLILSGSVPNLAIFIDGLNDFRQLDGFPEFTPSLHERMAPDSPFISPRPPATDAERKTASEWVLQRCQRNFRLVAGAAHQFGLRTVFVGQPVPFMEYPVNSTTYPFTQPNNDHRLCAFAYARFAQLAATGAFGPDFIWAADAFRDATVPMYADGIHYSPKGARRLAQVIAERMLPADSPSPPPLKK
jgi:hypothetical protein